MRSLAAAALAACMFACGGEDMGRSVAVVGPAAEQSTSIDGIAEDFVRLGLELGVYDEAYVDAYHGPEAWRTTAQASPRSLPELKAAAASLLDRLDAVEVEDRAEARVQLLRKQVLAAHTRARMAIGETLSFDEETRLLYDIIAPSYDLAAFDEALAAIEALLPGDGPLNERVDEFRESLAIPGDRLSTVIDAAISECRRRTADHYDLPEGENFSVGYVVDKPWGGYNWYQGGYASLIEINTDLPVIIDRAVDLGCHEGYPGHHTWNVFIERDFVDANGWTEYVIQPLFGPLALIAEGSANYGVEIAFPDGEKSAFERDELFPLAGLDPTQAERLEALKEAQRALSHARNHIAREYLDRRIDRETALSLLMKYQLTSRIRAEQSLDFIETYRGYVLNYNIGRDLVAAYVETQGGDRWSAFEQLLTTPLSASDLLAIAADGPEAE